MKRFGYRILLAGMVLALLVCGVGCELIFDYDYENGIVGMLSDRDSTQDAKLGEGKGYPDMSEHFDFTVYPAHMIMDMGGKNIEYSFDIVNKSDQSFKDFSLTVLPNDEIGRYLKQGVLPMEGTPFMLSPQGVEPTEDFWCTGVSMSCSWILSNDKILEEQGLNAADAPEAGGAFELLLKWDGGEERHRFTVDVVDELQG